MPASAARYTRVTVVGSRRAADVVCPAEEPLGRLLPDLLRLIGDEAPDEPRGRLVVRLDGVALDLDAGLLQAGVVDGQVLRVVEARDAPATPTVHDVSESLAEDIETARRRWGASARRPWFTVLAAAWAVSCLVLASGTHGSAVPAWIVAGAAAVAGTVIGRLIHPPLGTALIVTGWASAAWGAWLSSATGGHHSLAHASALLAIATAAALAALSVTTGLGRSAAVSAVVLLVVTGLWVACIAGGLPWVRAAAILAGLSCVAIGVLPRVALIASKLTSYDDRVAADGDVPRRSVSAAVGQAHRMLTLSTIAIAASIAMAGVVLAAHAGRWSVTLAVLAAVVTALRSRAFPLAAQVVALTAAAATVSVALLVAWHAHDTWPAVVVAGGGGVLTLVALVVDPPAHVRAWVRRLFDRVESLASVALLPVALGMFGVYGDLLHAF